MSEAPQLDRRQFLKKSLEKVAEAGAVAAFGTEVLAADSPEAADTIRYEPFDRSFEGPLELFTAEVSKRIAASTRLKDAFFELQRAYGDSVRLEKPMTDQKVRALYETYILEGRKVTSDGDFVKSFFKKYLDGLPEDQCRKYGVQNCLTAHKLSQDWDTEVWSHILGVNIAQEALDRK